MLLFVEVMLIFIMSTTPTPLGLGVIGLASIIAWGLQSLNTHHQGALENT